MASLDKTSGAALLKILYPTGVQELWYPETPWLAQMPKSEDGGGTNFQINTTTSGLVSSNDFATALAEMNNPELPTFNVTWVDTYAFGSVKNKMIMRSKGNKKAIVDALKQQTDSAAQGFGRNVGHQAWWNKGGAIGKVASISTNTITLKAAAPHSVWDIVNFTKNMKVVFSSTDGTAGGAPNKLGSTKVTKVVRESNTFDVTATDITTIAADDFVFREGNFGICASGVLDWVPATAPTGGDSHYGVDRSDDPTWLAGGRFTGAGTIEQSIIDAEGEGATHGGIFNQGWLHPKRFAQLKKEIQGKAWYDQSGVPVGATLSPEAKGRGAKTNISFRGFAFQGDHGPITMMSDRNAPYPYSLLTRREAWLCNSIGPMPHFDEQSGSRLLVETSNDGKQFRKKAYWNVMCLVPKDNMLVTLPA